MQQLIRQLEQIRGRARLMLIVMYGSMWLAAVIGVAVAAGLLDYLLRLPGGLRLALLLVGLGAGGFTAAVYLGRPLRVRPALTALAWRLERMYPSAAGRLASAVAFSTESGRDESDEASPVADQLTRQATADATGRLHRDEVRRLIAPGATLRGVLMLGVAALVLASFTLAAPAAVSTAAQRWLLPLGDAQWPNRYQIESATDAEVAPDDAPLHVEARVVKGDYDGLRAWVVYRFETQEEGEARPRRGEWQRALMTRQSGSSRAGEYQRLIEPQSGATAVTFYFEAGDDRTGQQTVGLIRPPRLASFTADVEPPAYAAEIVPPQRHHPLNPRRPTVTIEALAGSRVELRVGIDGSLEHPPDSADDQAVRQWIGRTLRGLFDPPPASEELDAEEFDRPLDLTYARDESAAEDFAFTLSWTLRRPAAFRFGFHDEHGAGYEDQRLFRFETRPDRPPRATMLEPAGDESVLPTATVPLAAEAQDDVAVEHLALAARRGAGDEADPRLLATDDQLQPRARLGAELDVSELDLEPGDELAVLAIARDNFDLDGERHGPVESTPRILRIISEAEMIDQIRTDLAELRQRAIRARNVQQRLEEDEPDRRNAEQQRALVDRVESMSRSVEQVRRRAEQNRLEDERIEQTLDEAERLTGGASEAASEAAERMAEAAAGDPDDDQTREAAEQARESQQETREQLDELVDLLDRGRDAYELTQRLTRLAQEQRELSDQARELLPRTLGQDPDQIEGQDREDLDELTDRQREAAEEARELAERMRSTADSLSRQSDRPEDQANAQSLQEAADTAAREGLDERMDEASDEAEQNRLAQAQDRQEQAQDILDRMLEQVDRAEQLRLAILQRRLMELIEAIRELRDQQRVELDRLEAADALDGLDGPMLRLRRNTLAVAEEARGTDAQLRPVAELLERAAGYQADAVRRLRAADASRDAAERAERDALAKLEEALELAQRIAEENRQEMGDDRRRELVAEYRKALETQREILEETQTLGGVEQAERNRRWRAASMEQGNRQADLREQFGNLEEQLEETIVYKSVHDQIDTWAAGAVERLRGGDPGPRTQFNQRMIVSSLEALIDALRPGEPDEQFAMDGGGGGGEGEAGEPPLVPDMAEVKLLRARQTHVHRLTRLVDEQPGQDPEDRDHMIESLSHQQDDLGRVGEQLIEALQQQQQQQQRPGGDTPRPGPGPGPGPQPPAPETRGDSEPALRSGSALAPIGVATE